MTREDPSPMMNSYEYIIKNLPQTEILAQLAEECSELSHAALKLRRVLDGTNPTPKSKADAQRAMVEEIADVLNCLAIVDDGLPGGEVSAAILSGICDAKMERWANRLKERKEGDKTP